jgi:hypothetical protein
MYEACRPADLLKRCGRDVDALSAGLDTYPELKDAKPDLLTGEVERQVRYIEPAKK